MGLTETDFRVLDERKVRQLAPFVTHEPIAAPNRPGLQTNRPRGCAWKDRAS
jgi:hypothetical protein